MLDLLFSCRDLYLSSRDCLSCARLAIYSFRSRFSWPCSILNNSNSLDLAPSYSTISCKQQELINQHADYKDKYSTKYTYCDKLLALCHVLLNKFNLVRRQLWLLYRYMRSRPSRRQRTCLHTSVPATHHPWWCAPWLLLAGVLDMQMVQCNAWLHFYPQIPRKEVRAATTLLYLNVCCCSGTYRTNLATVSSYAYSIWECKCMIAMHELHIPPNLELQEQCHK